MSHTGTSISMHICSFVAAVLGLLCVNTHVLCRVTLLRTLHLLITCRFFIYLFIFLHVCVGVQHKPFAFYRNLWVYSEIYGVCNVNYCAICGGSPSGNKSFKSVVGPK